MQDASQAEVFRDHTQCQHKGCMSDSASVYVCVCVCE